MKRNSHAGNIPKRTRKIPKSQRARLELAKAGGRLTVPQLSKALDVSKWAIYKALPRWGSDFILDKGVVSLKLTTRDWAELFSDLNEGTYPETGFAAMTDPPIVIRRVAGQVAGALGADPQDKKLVGEIRRVHADRMNRIDWNAYKESRKPENDLAFAKANLDVVKPLADLGLTRKIVTRVPALSSDWKP